MPKDTAEWFGAQYGYGSIVPKSGGGDTSFGVATVKPAGFDSLNGGQRLERDANRERRHRFSAVNLRPVD